MNPFCPVNENVPSDWNNYLCKQKKQHLLLRTSRPSSTRNALPVCSYAQQRRNAPPAAEWLYCYKIHQRACNKSQQTDQQSPGQAIIPVRPSTISTLPAHSHKLPPSAKTADPADSSCYIQEYIHFSSLPGKTPTYSDHTAGMTPEKRRTKNNRMKTTAFS